MQYYRNPLDYYTFYVKALEPKTHKGVYSKLEDNEGQAIDSDLDNTPDKLKEEYMGV